MYHSHTLELKHPVTISLSMTNSYGMLFDLKKYLTMFFVVYKSVSLYISIY